MISASKTTFCHYNIKILWPKVTQNIKNLRKKFCESAPRGQKRGKKYHICVLPQALNTNAEQNGNYSLVNR